MGLTWKLSEIRTRWREDTGRNLTSDISDDDVDALINDYYVNKFPQDASVDEFNGFFTQALIATDSGIYAVAQNIDRLDDPVTINGSQIVLYRDREVFFGGEGGGDHHFHSTLNIGLGQYFDEQYITEPTLAIGSSDTTKVKHSDFTYRIKRYSYSKASSEVTLTGDTIPQNKYGAWSLKIDEDGTITVAAAGDNDTGYATARKALEGLANAGSDSAYMGYITVISTDSDGFVSGTTVLDDSAVTDTYTDGQFEKRNTPIAALLYGQNLYVRPKPNDIYEFKALTIADRPAAFTGASDAPDDLKWGPAIARGAALLAQQADEKGETVAELRRKVTSPGGTTEAAMKEFAEGGFGALVAGAIEKARDRGRELAK